jgi:PAS domain S-box-containing protein
VSTSRRVLIEEDIRELYENAPCGYLSSFIDGTILGVNQTFLNWTGHTREELLSGKRLQELLTVPGQIFYETQYAPLLQMQGFVKEVALEIVRKTGDPLPVLVNSIRQQSREHTSTVIRSTFFDATERRKYERDLLNARRNLEEQVVNRTAALEREVSERRSAENSLKELTSKLLKLQDEERRRLARDLHDSVGQLLTATIMNLDAMARESSNFSNRGKKCLTEAAELVRETVKEIRVVSYLLHPPQLDESGLPSALQWYLDGFSKRGDIIAELVVSDEFGRLPQDLETALFRIVQECLTNIHRHSGSKTAVVRLFRSADEVQIEVRDFGKGMARELSYGVGLRGMKERVEEFGGTLNIQSSSTGTAVSAKVPLASPGRHG